MSAIFVKKMLASIGEVIIPEIVARFRREQATVRLDVGAALLMEWVVSRPSTGTLPDAALCSGVTIEYSHS